MNQVRSSRGVLFAPATQPTHSPASRIDWLAKAVAGFATTQPAQKTYYRIILKRLWPEGQGIPGPHVSEEEFRAAINEHRRTEGKEPYLDVFRRLRELQGDEGFTSIVKSGRNYQLQSLEIGPKRQKRGRPKKAVWNQLLEASDHRCAKCGRAEPDIKLSPDHRVPRSRGGTNDDENWQPLCVGCNTLKSSACNDCQRKCYVCFWAYPETYKELTINDDNRAYVKDYAERNKIEQSEAMNKILRSFFLNEKRS